MIKLTTNIKKQIEAVGDLKKLNQAVVAKALKDVASYARKEAARQIRDTRYSTSPLGLIRSKIYVNAKKTGKQVPLGEQSSETGVRGGDIPVFYMRARNKIVQTHVGKRWGVVIGRGEGAPKKAFHLKSRGPGKLVQAGGQPFDRHSKLFVRVGTGRAIEAVKFKTFSEVIIDNNRERILLERSAAWLDKRVERLWKQYLYQISRVQQG